MKAGKYARFEIERRFVLEELPKVGEYVELEDIYIADSRLRLRIVRSLTGEILHRKLTQKQPAPGREPSVTVISTIYLSSADLSALGELHGARVVKKRYAGGPGVVIDVYPHGPIIAEVEFETEDDRDAFVVPPGWREVTGDAAYSGATLAAR